MQAMEEREWEVAAVVATGVGMASMFVAEAAEWLGEGVAVVEGEEDVEAVVASAVGRFAAESQEVWAAAVGEAGVAGSSAC